MSAIFVTISNRGDLERCLRTGVYGQYMKEQCEPTQNHYRVLSDYCMASPGDKVYFFHERNIYYAGELDAEGAPAFYLNGSPPFGEEEPEVWTRGDGNQPYLFLIENDKHVGSKFKSDIFYNRLSELNFPVPSNSIENRGFCHVTPGEENLLWKLTKRSSETADVDTKSRIVDDIKQRGTRFRADSFFPESISEAENEAHAEAILSARASKREKAFCRQVPFSPYRPSMDRIDICRYSKGSLAPEVATELKVRKAGKRSALQMERYRKWAKPRDISLCIIAPDYTSTFKGYITNPGEITMLRF